MKVQVKDYQIIKHAEAEFVPGLNVIVGPSNNGKTSFIKAMKALMYTEPGSTPIRHGTQAYIVGIQHEGHTVILQKGLKDSAYLVDGEKFTKYGTTTPEAVSNALRIKELELNGKKEKINFWDQMNYPFLLDKSSTELFRFIVDSGEDDQVSAALKDMVSDRQGINKEINQIQGAIVVLDEQISNKIREIEALQPKVETSKKIIELQPRIANIRQLEASLKKIKELQQNRETLTKQVEKAQSDFTLWNKFSLSLVDLFEKYSVYSRTLTKISVLKENVEKLTTKNASHVSLLNKLENVSGVNLMPLVEVRNKLLGLTSKVQSLENSKGIEITVDTKKVEEELLTLTNMKSSHTHICRQSRFKEEKEEGIQMYTELIDKLEKVQSCVPVCPYCGQTLHNN